MRFSFASIKQEIVKAQKSYFEEFNSLGRDAYLKFKYIYAFVMAVSHKLTLLCLGVKLKVLAEAAENYNAVLAENRKMFNEIQDLKGATT